MARLLTLVAAAALAGGTAPATTGDGLISSTLTRLGAVREAPSWSFAVVGDSRNNPGVLYAALERIDSFRPRFTLFTGDMGAQQAEWQDVWQHIKGRYQTPLLPAMGNHETYSPLGIEDYGAGVDLFTRFFGNPSPHPVGPVDYAFDHGGARFILLDNSREGRLEMTDAQLAWLDGELKGGGPVQFVAAHKPPRLGTEWSHAFHHNAERFVGLLQGRATAAFFGHIHFYDRHQVGALPLFVSGGAGAPLWGDATGAWQPGLFHSPFGRSAHNFLIVDVARGHARASAYTDSTALAALPVGQRRAFIPQPGDFQLLERVELPAPGKVAQPAIRK